MKRRTFAISLLVVALATGLGVIAYVVDQLRASVRVVPGLGEASEPEREEELVVPGESGDDFESARLAPRGRARPAPSGLLVQVVSADGKGIPFAEVLAFRGDEFARAGHSRSGLASLIPFDGPGTLRVELDTFELARLEIPEGRGRHEIRVPALASVTGIVRIGGVPREGVELELLTGSHDWPGNWIRYGLEAAGLRRRASLQQVQTAVDGSFRFLRLAPDWVGAIRPARSGDYRLAGGERQLELRRPQEDLVLQLEPLRPELVIRGRTTLAGQPVPGATWNLGFGWSRCDEQGRFSIHAFAEELRGEFLELSKPDVGARRIAVESEVSLDGFSLNLGDVELVPTRSVPFAVRSESGGAIVGATARPRAPPGTSDRDHLTALGHASRPTDSAGQGALSLGPSERVIRVSARGYGLTDVAVPESLSERLEVVLPRCAAFHVVLRDRVGRVPAGLRVRLEARAPPFTFANGVTPEEDELTAMELFRRGARLADGRYVEDFLVDERGRAWVDPLRAGESLDVLAIDAFGRGVAAERELVLAAGEWRRVDLRVEGEPRTLIVLVRDSLNAPLAGAEVKLASELEGESLVLHTDRAGMVRTEPFYASELALSVSCKGFESRTLPHLAVPREGATVEIRLAHDWRGER